MDTAKAIQLLHRLQDEQFDGPHGDERREALEMAVRALESNLVKGSDGLVQDLVKDCISRKALCEYALNQKDKSITPNDIMRFPSAQPVNYGSTKSGSSSQLKLNNDLISRQQAIDAHCELCGDRDKCNCDICPDVEVFQLLPSAQPERKKGKWIKLDMHEHIADHKCTACGQECYVPTCMGEPMYTYCPSCGARMDGENE